MLKKITFTPDHSKYDALELLNRSLNKGMLSINFLRELRSKHDIDRLAELYIFPLNTLLQFEEYKPVDIHYLLNTAESLGIQFGSLPDWYAEAASKNERAETLRFLHCPLDSIRWPYTSPSFNREAILYLQEQGIERVYQFLLMDKSGLPPKLNKKLLDSYNFFIEMNDLENFKVTVNPDNN